jgi:hypothetical protein
MISIRLEALQSIHNRKNVLMTTCSNGGFLVDIVFRICESISHNSKIQPWSYMINSLMP